MIRVYVCYQFLEKIGEITVYDIIKNKQDSFVCTINQDC